MKWAHISFAASLSFSGASASSNAVLGARSNVLSHQLEAPLERRNASTPTLNVLTRFLHRRQAGRCGPDGGGARCPDDQCCSLYGYCGTEFEFCGEIVGCQPQYGRCGDAPPPPPPSSTPTPTPTPIPSSSSTPVVPPSSSVAPPLPSGTLIVSPNGQCGNSTICTGSGFGNCCSEWYFCGNDASYCGTGCRPGFGTCGGGVVPPISSSSSRAPVPSSSPPPVVSSSTPTPTPTSSPRPSPTSSARPTPTVPTTTDGRCGNGISCGGNFGPCCSEYGWCGAEIDYCGTRYGCQPQWGTCS